MSGSQTKVNAQAAKKVVSTEHYAYTTDFQPPR